MPRAALESLVREAITMGGDEPDDDEVAAIVADAVDIRPAELGAMCDMLERHGDRYTGSPVDDADLTPSQVSDAADRMIADVRDERYTDGSPIYAACNGDILAQEIIDACE